MLARIKDDDSVSYQRFSDSAELQRLVEDDLAVLLSERFEMTRPAGRAADAAPADAPSRRPRRRWSTASRRPRRWKTWWPARTSG